MSSTPRMKYRQKWQENNRRSKGIQPQRIAPCGTPAAYRRHLRNKKLAEAFLAEGRPDELVDGRPAYVVATDPIDEACREAWNEDAKERRDAAKAERKAAKAAKAPTGRKARKATKAA